jgi:hypothetical protein
MLAKRFIAAAAATFCAVSALAGTLTVSSPTQGAYLGANNTLRFLARGASVEVTVTAVVTGPGGSTTIQDKFTPNAQGEVSGSLPLNFSEGSPEGAYNIVVTATEPNNTYNQVNVDVVVDVVRPKLLESSPRSGSYVRGLVPLFARVLETNPKDWRVRINGQDIPNNTGESNTIDVDWNTDLIPQDGPQNVAIRVRDLADNELNHSFTVTLDRVAPVSTIQFPRSDTRIRSGQMINVVIDVADASTSSVDVTGLDVIATTMDDQFLTRVARISFRPAGGNAMRWTGRIRYRRNLLPNQFKLVVTAVDRAGNVAVPQHLNIRVGR